MLKGYNNVRKSSPNNRTPARKLMTEKLNPNATKETDEHLNDKIKKGVSSSNSEKVAAGETPV